MAKCEVCGKETLRRKKGYREHDGKMCCPVCYDACSNFERLAELIMGR